MKRIFIAIIAICIAFGGCAKTQQTEDSTNNGIVSTSGTAEIAQTTKTADNPFTAPNAIKGQVGELYYVVPEGADAVESAAESIIVYEMPIKNSSETFSLSVYFNSKSEIESTQTFENFISEIKARNKASIQSTDDFQYQEIDEAFETNVLYGYTGSYVNEGKKWQALCFAIDSGFYMISYSAKTAFFDESIWENFYAQLKLV